MNCIHCAERKGQKYRRGMCERCYMTPEVRAKYPSTSKYAAKKGGWCRQDHKKAEAATVAMPGSEEKIAVLMARLERGEELFHERDPVIEHVPRKDSRGKFHGNYIWEREANFETAFANYSEPSMMYAS